MRPFHLLNVASGRVSLVRNVVYHERSNATSKSFISMASTRQQQTARQYSTERVKASPWSQHPLKTSHPTASDLDRLSKTPKNVTGKYTAYIALGSNLGNRIETIEKACNLIEERGIRIKRTSSLWETEPMYVLDQGSFVNGACEVETTLEPLALLDALQDVENTMGRKKIIDKGPRNIDLDILLYDDQVVNHERLKVPHPLMFEREFVLRPLAELIPGKPLDAASPWKVTQDYLNALPPSPPITTITPLAPGLEPLRALKTDRKTRIMKIVNVTPDSFSDGGLHYEEPSLPNVMSPKSRVAVRDNIDTIHSLSETIVDIGGQSTAPKAKDISSDEEIKRIRDYLSTSKLASLRNKAISIDTFYASVAKFAVEHGAEIINDISAGALDPKMLPTMAKLGKTVILMHMRGTPSTMTKLTSYPDGLIPTIANELLARVAAAEKAGIRRWRIILDPGIGFAKNQEQNLEILRRLDELRDWPGLRGLPWLVGSSRKRFIGRITGVEKPDERQWGTAATVAAAIHGGADIVRVHDVEEMTQVAKMSDAIWRS